MPLPNVYSEQIRAWDTDVPTTRRLPSGEVLVGNKSYESLMRFFTTFNITPTVLKKKAWERLYDLHNQVWLKFVSFKFVAVHWFREGFCWNCTLSLELSVYVVFISLAQNPGYLNGKGISKINICQMSVNSNFRGFWLAHVTRNILTLAIHCFATEAKMASRFQTFPEDEIWAIKEAVVQTNTNFGLSRGGTFWVGMCHWDPGTLSLYQS